MSDDPASWGAVPAQKDDDPASWGAKPSGGDFSWSKAVTDIPSEIGKEASSGAADVAALANRGEVGKGEPFFSPSAAAEGLMAVPKAVMGALRVPLSPLVGGARSLVGHTMANLEHKAGEYLAPEIAAKDDPQKMYEAAKGDVDTALSAVRPGGAPIKVAGPSVTTTHPTTGASITTAPKPAYEWQTSAPGITPGSKLKPVGRVEQPPTEAFFDSADNHYANMRGYGVEIDRAAMNRVADNITNELSAEGYRPRNVPKVFDAIEELRTPAGAHHEIADIDSVRKVLGKARLDHTERDAARRAIGHIDDYLADLHNNPGDVVNNPHFAGRVAESAQNARADYAVAKRAEDVEEAIEQAERQAARAGSGGNINNAIRQRLSSLRNNKKKMAGWTDAEKAELDKVINGTATANVARSAGKFAPHGVVSTVLSAGAGHMVAPGIGEVAVPAAGYIAKGVGDRMTMKAAERLLNFIKARSALGRETSINAAAKSALSPPSRKALASSSALPITQSHLPQIPRVIMNTAEFSGSKEAQAEDEKRRRQRNNEPDQGAGGKSHGGRVRRLGGAVGRAIRASKGYADGGSPFDYSGVGEAMPESIGRERIMDPMITIPKRIGYDLPKELIEHSQANPLPGLRREDYTDVPADTSSDPNSPLGGVGIAVPRMGWQPVDPMIGGSLEAGMNVIGGTAFSAPKGALGAGPAMIKTEKEVASPIWRSAVEDAIETLPMKSAPADQWAATLRNAKGIKPEEMDWLGLQDFFAAKKAAGEKVTKQELMDHVAGNKIEIKDVVKGDIPWDKLSPARQDRIVDDFHEVHPDVHTSANPDWGAVEDFYNRLRSEGEYRVGSGEDGTKFHSYQLPGGENYREHLLTMPYEKRGLKLQEGETAIDALNRQQAEHPAPYKSPHWDEPNVLAHVRSNDRVMETPEGPKKSLHLEEIQSDWHQKGRKAGYRDEQEKQMADLVKQRDAIGKELHDLGPNAEYTPEYGKRIDEMNALHDKIRELGTSDVGVPNAPFKDTDAWAGLALKRMIRHAAEKGYDRISWTPGEAQAARYDLSKQVEAIRANKNPDGTYQLGIQQHGRNMQKHDTSVPADKLSDLVGKDLAEKIVKEVTEPGVESGKIFSDLDLKVGGEGMREFYDKMLPKIAEKIGKAHGVKVKQTKLPSDNVRKTVDDRYTVVGDRRTFDTLAEAQEAAGQLVHYFDIPQSLKNQAMKGMNMFRKGGRVTFGKPRSRSVALNIAYQSKRNAHGGFGRA